MRKGVASAVAALVVAAAGAGAEEAKQTPGAEVTGWATAGPADLAILEELEGENLAEARKAKGTTLEIQSARKDLDKDGIPELFVFVKHPMFCYDEAGGCTLLVIRRASLSDPWREIAVITAAAPSLVVGPSRPGEFPALRPLGSRPYGWDGRQYQEDRGGAPAVSSSDTGGR